MDILDKKSPMVFSFFAQLDESLHLIRKIFQHHTPHLNGEKFLTGNEVCKSLHISPRTLQEWRNSKVLPYIKLSGKILYKQSDILNCLENHTVR